MEALVVEPHSNNPRSRAGYPPAGRAAGAVRAVYDGVRGINLGGGEPYGPDAAQAGAGHEISLGTTHGTYGKGYDGKAKIWEIDGKSI